MFTACIAQSILILGVACQSESKAPATPAIRIESALGTVEFITPKDLKPVDEKDFGQHLDEIIQLNKDNLNAIKTWTGKATLNYSTGMALSKRGLAVTKFQLDQASNNLKFHSDYFKLKDGKPGSKFGYAMKMQSGPDLFRLGPVILDTPTPIRNTLIIRAGRIRPSLLGDFSPLTYFEVFDETLSERLTLWKKYLRPVSLFKFFLLKNDSITRVISQNRKQPELKTIIDIDRTQGPTSNSF